MDGDWDLDLRSQDCEVRHREVHPCLVYGKTEHPDKSIFLPPSFVDQPTQPDPRTAKFDPILATRVAPPWESDQSNLSSLPSKRKRPAEPSSQPAVSQGRE